MKLKLILLLIFIILNSIVFFITGVNKEQRISKALKSDLKHLETTYKTLGYHQQQNNKSILKSIKSEALPFLSQLDGKSEKELSEIRTKFYTAFKKRYLSMKLRGVYQLQFVLPNNKTFLRFHRPEKFGDDLSKIRYSFTYVNKYHTPIEGFEGGKTTHAYRYVYPLFDKRGHYICAVEISYTSDYLQNYITNIANIHTHFIVNKKVFDENVWNRVDKQIIYQKSAEHSDFMLTMTKQHTIQNCIINNNKRFENIIEEVKEKIDLQKPFSIYTTHENLNDVNHVHNTFINSDIVSFYPIKSTLNKNEAWLVSYTPNDFIEITILGNNIVRGITFIIFSILIYVIYRNIMQKKEFEVIFNTSKDPIAILDTESNFLDFNDAYMEITGYTRKELKQKSCMSMTIPEDIPKAKETIKEVLHKGVVKNFEKSCITKDGSIISINMTLSLMPDKQRIIVSTKDMSEIKAKELILREQTKLASMGEMIGNIAHQWRQPLSLISSSSTGILVYRDMGVLNDKILDDEMNRINDNAQYLSKTIDDFRDFIKGDRKLIEFNMSENIHSFLTLVQANIKNHEINMILDLDDTLKILGYPNELNQCCINIFNNAKDALKEIDGERYIFINTKKDTQNVKIEIKDNAGGIPKDILPKIFEPYFTTKHQSQGTGLGLSMVYSLVTEGMQGTIEVSNTTYTYNNEEYTGAQFIITLPLKATPLQV
jgi:PAS domain S-box-containing protein